MHIDTSAHMQAEAVSRQPVLALKCHKWADLSTRSLMQMQSGMHVIKVCSVESIKLCAWSGLIEINFLMTHTFL